VLQCAEHSLSKKLGEEALDRVVFLLLGFFVVVTIFVVFVVLVF